MFGTSAAGYNAKVISPNAMRVTVPSRASMGLVDVSLACKENNRSLCKISSSSVTFRYSTPNELESNFSRMQELINKFSKDQIKLSKEAMLRKANDILERICQHSIFQQIGLQALTESAVADLASSALTSANNSTNSTGSTSSLNSNGSSVSSISSRMNLNASLPSNLNNLISNTNMMMNNVHSNQLGHHLNSTSAGSPVANSSASQLNLMTSNLTNNLSTNSNSNSSSGSNNGTPTQMINHNSINHTTIKYENAYPNNVASAASTSHMMNSSSRNVSHHHTSSYISSQNMQSTSNFLNGYINPFALAPAVNQSYQLY